MFEEPQPIKFKYFTPGVIILCLIAINGLAFIAARIIFGIGSVTNLNNLYPWGLWIGVDVAAGVALAAGGFTSAALGHVMHKEQFHAIVRPALLTAMLGYTFVAMAVAVDIGRYYYIWHPLVMWNPNSALFEVGICVMIYLTVLYIEFMPILTEKLNGKIKFNGLLHYLNEPLNKLVNFLDKILSKAMFVFIIAGVVLSTLHQSSLGTLMVIAGNKMHPLWQTPVLPLMFLISAISVGFPMVIFESMLASRSLGIKPEMEVLSKLGRFVGPILGIYLAFKLGDMFIRETFRYLAHFNIESVMFIFEMVFGVIVPLIMFLMDRVLKSPLKLFIGSCLVIFGVLLNRINNFIIAYHPPYSKEAYIPSFGEFSVTIGCIAMLVLLYRLAVRYLPVINLHQHPMKVVIDE
ncbi:MAG: Ni/Fe-hydrogenase cytochrome b subunit [Bacteroidetes bacterium]|nr:MAG: Ni/Fe-hydrogenase cytochrome b subunit [Bacteroidota bacterium]